MQRWWTTWRRSGGGTRPAAAWRRRPMPRCLMCRWPRRARGRGRAGAGGRCRAAHALAALLRCCWAARGRCGMPSWRRAASPPRRVPAWPRSLINARAEPEPSVLQRFAELLLDIVLSCQGDLAPQVGAWGCTGMHTVPVPPGAPSTAPRVAPAAGPLGAAAAQAAARAPAQAQVSRGARGCACRVAPGCPGVRPCLGASALCCLPLCPPGRMTVPWRPLYTLLHRYGLEPSAAYEGATLALPACWPCAALRCAALPCAALPGPAMPRAGHALVAPLLHAADAPPAPWVSSPWRRRRRGGGPAPGADHAGAPLPPLLPSRVRGGDLGHV